MVWDAIGTLAGIFSVRDTVRRETRSVETRQGLTLGHRANYGVVIRVLLRA